MYLFIGGCHELSSLTHQHVAKNNEEKLSQSSKQAKLVTVFDFNKNNTKTARFSYKFLSRLA